MNNTDLSTTGTIIMGTSIGLSALPGIMGNLFVCILFVKKGLLKPKQSSVYKLSFSLMIADTVHLLVFLCYLTPSAALQTWLVPWEKYRHLPGTIIVLCWDVMAITLNLLAVNRYLAVAKPHLYKRWFQCKNTLVMIGCSWMLALLLTLMAQVWLPCCPIYLFYKFYTYAYIDDISLINYGNYLTVLPLNVGSALNIVIMYTLLFVNIRSTNRKVENAVTAQRMHHRRQREIRFASQIAVTSFCYASIFILFQTLALTLPPDHAYAFSVMTFLEIINVSCNAFGYLVMNADAREELKKWFRKAFCFPDSINVSNAEAKPVPDLGDND